MEKEKSIEELAEAVLDNIRNARKKRGYTQENIAFDLNISVTWYQRLEQGKSTLTVPLLLRIARVLDIPACSLLFTNEPPHDENYYKVLLALDSLLQ